MGCTQSANATSDDAQVEARAAAAKIYEGRIAELERRIAQQNVNEKLLTERDVQIAELERWIASQFGNRAV